MGRLARIPNDIYREVRKIQEEFKLKNGIDLSFPKAMKLWERKMKGFKKDKRWRFPEFS